MAENVKLFLSCVSDEFGAEREALRHELTGLTVDVAIQEDFVALGGDTLAKLDAYIRQCDVVVHLAGEMTGAPPLPRWPPPRPARRAGPRRSAPR
jgi:hypothetical protein